MILKSIWAKLTKTKQILVHYLVDEEVIENSFDKVILTVIWIVLQHEHWTTEHKQTDKEQNYEDSDILNCFIQQWHVECCAFEKFKPFE